MSGHSIRGSLNIGRKYVMAVDGITKAWPVPADAGRVNINAAGNTPTIQGIAGGVDTRALFVMNSSGVSVLVSNQAISGSNKTILQTADQYILNGHGAMFWYDGDAQGWRMLAGGM